MKYTKVMVIPSKRNNLFKTVATIIKKLLRSEESPKETTVSSNEVFMLPSHSLPSQYKTLLPVSDVAIERLMKLERRRRLIRNVTLTLTALIVIFIIVIVTLIIVLHLSLHEERGRLQLTAVHVNKTRFHVDEIKLLKAKAMVKPPTRAKGMTKKQQSGNGVPCISMCWDYAAFRFKAECVDGFCLCRDKNYDDVTCLPRSGDCVIKKFKVHPLFHASHGGRVQTSYSCTPPRTVPVPRPDVHIISMYGNKRVPATDLHIKSSRTHNATLVLVSYEPVLWNLDLSENVTVEEIILISHYAVSRTKVNIMTSKKEDFTSSSLFSTTTTTTTTKQSHTEALTLTHKTSPISAKPSSKGTTQPSDRAITTTVSPSLYHISQPIRIMRLMLQTGYGDDRSSGDTPFLLDEISKRVGPIASFFGVAHADNIVFDAGKIKYDVDPPKYVKSPYSKAGIENET